MPRRTSHGGVARVATIGCGSDRVGAALCSKTKNKQNPAAHLGLQVVVSRPSGCGRAFHTLLDVSPLVDNCPVLRVSLSWTWKEQVKRGREDFPAPEGFVFSTAPRVLVCTWWPRPSRMRNHKPRISSPGGRASSRRRRSAGSLVLTRRRRSRWRGSSSWCRPSSCTTCSASRRRDSARRRSASYVSTATCCSVSTSKRSTSARQTRDVITSPLRLRSGRDHTTSPHCVTSGHDHFTWRHRVTWERDFTLWRPYVTPPRDVRTWLHHTTSGHDLTTYVMWPRDPTMWCQCVTFTPHLHRVTSQSDVKMWRHQCVTFKPHPHRVTSPRDLTTWSNHVISQCVIFHLTWLHLTWSRRTTSTFPDSVIWAASVSLFAWSGVSREVPAKTFLYFWN